MKVADVMQRPVYSATPTTTAREVAVNLLMSRISGFPIVDHSGALVGIVTELDLIRALRAGKDLEVTLAAEIMTPDVITVDAEESVEAVIDAALEAGCGVHASFTDPPGFRGTERFGSRSALGLAWTHPR